MHRRAIPIPFSGSTVTGLVLTGKTSAPAWIVDGFCFDSRRPICAINDAGSWLLIDGDILKAASKARLSGVVVTGVPPRSNVSGRVGALERRHPAIDSRYRLSILWPGCLNTPNCFLERSTC